MSTINEAVRSNYFRVTDEEKYEELFKGLCGEVTVYSFSNVDEKGNLLHGFGCYSGIDYLYTSEDGEEVYDIEEFYKRLQKILPDGEAFILMGASYEKLIYAVGDVTVVTNKEIRYENTMSLALTMARDMLNNPNFDTQLDY